LFLRAFFDNPGNRRYYATFDLAPASTISARGAISRRATRAARKAVAMRGNERPRDAGSSRAKRRSRFEAFELVQQRGTVSGEIAPSKLERIADSLASDAGRVAYAIAGTTDEAERPALDVRIDGELELTCQRCLKPMTWRASQRITLLLAHDERELALLDDSDEREVVLADESLDPIELVEDELLLTMPYAPRHPQSEAALCVPANDGEPQPDKPASPFGALAELKAARAPGKGKPAKR
jgi:uncharacterized protein